MFCIINKTTGRRIGMTDKINFIKRSPDTGCFISATEDDAIGIAYKGKPYNIRDLKEIEDVDSVIIQEFDSGFTVEDIKSREETIRKQLAETDEAAIELYEANMMLEQANAEQDEAIIEIYEMMGEVING